jgi:hypothetical protein
MDFENSFKKFKKVGNLVQTEIIVTYKIKSVGVKIFTIGVSYAAKKRLTCL